MKVKIINEQNGELKKQNALNLIPFSQGGIINFKSEMQGLSKSLVNFGKISQGLGGITLVGAISNNCGINKKSVFVFNCGKLISICDMNACEEKFSGSHGLKIIPYENQKIGVLVDKDLFSLNAVSSLVTCGCSAIINLYKDFSTKKAVVASEFYSYIHSVNFVHYSQNQFCAFSCKGEKIEPVFGEVVLENSPTFKECKIKRRTNV